MSTGYRKPPQDIQDIFHYCETQVTNVCKALIIDKHQHMDFFTFKTVLV